MSQPVRPRSAQAFAELARTVAGGESSYARLRTGDAVVIERAAGARRIGSMLQPFTSPLPGREPRTPAEVSLLQDDALYAQLCDALERHGIYAHRYGLGRWFASTAHDDAVVEETLARIRNAVADLE